MMILTRTACLSLLLCLAALAQPALAQTMMFNEMDPSVSYSAWRHVETGGRSMEMREYHAPGMQRLEMNAQGQDMVMIHRNDTGESWMIMPQMQAYMQTSAERVAQSSGDVEIVERTRVGRERVNGYDTIKYKAVFRDPQGQEGSGYFWLTEQHGIPIRTDMMQQTPHGKQRVYMELTDLQVGSQPASLFEVPDGYRALPGGMMGMGAMGGLSGSSGGQSMGGSGQSYLEQLEARKAQRAQEEQAQVGGQRSQQAGLSRLTQAYLEGCWFSVGGERAQIRINADGSYDVGTPAGSGFAMQRSGNSIQAFRSRYGGLVSMTDDRFVVRDRNRSLTYERGACVGGGGVAGDGYGSYDSRQDAGRGDTQPNPESNVVEETADKIKKGIGSFLDRF